MRKLLDHIAYNPTYYAIRIAVLLFLFFMVCVSVYAKPLAIAESGGVRITLFDEDCKMDAVKNLTYRITWSEKGATIEGCFTVHQGIVVAYFADKTIAIFPGTAFRQVTDL